MKAYILFFVLIITIAAVSQTPQWEFMGLAGEEIYDIAVDDSGNVYVGSEGGVFKSTDNGATWIFKNNGLQVGAVNKLFIDYEGNIYLGGSASFHGLYKSNDGGENWIGIADTLNGNPINYFFDFTIIPNAPGGVFYTSNYYGVYRSTDNGITWQSTNFTYPGAVDIGVNKNGYMFFGNNLASWFGIYRSTDLGLNWERHTFLGVTAMVYLRDGSVLAGCYDPWLGSYGIYKTTNNGDTWLNTNTFSGMSSPWDFSLDKNDDIYAAFVGAVFISTNNGTSWIDYGLTGPPTTCIAIDSSGYVWAGAHQDGVYRTAGRTVPVELVSFSAEVNGINVSLSWVTVSEMNNRGFEIQRASSLPDGKAGSTSPRRGDWVVIGFVDGYGTTTETNYYSFIDKNITDGTYLYRLKQIDFDGSFEYSNIIEVKVRIPSEYFLSQNYPNPFNPETNIDYRIPEETFVNISLYDVTGRKIKELINEKKQPGYYTIKLKGGELSSGIYFYRLSTTSGYTVAKKLSIIK
jgi:photosystem II stability/assembly factor-like uncharacterized protein